MRKAMECIGECRRDLTPDGLHSVPGRATRRHRLPTRDAAGAGPATS